MGVLSLFHEDRDVDPLAAYLFREEFLGRHGDIYCYLSSGRNSEENIRTLKTRQ